MSARTENRWAAERLDVLEDEFPRTSCQVRGCNRTAHYEHPGAWGTFWLCPHHRPIYRKHDRILQRIRQLPNKAIYS